MPRFLKTSPLNERFFKYPDVMLLEWHTQTFFYSFGWLGSGAGVVTAILIPFKFQIWMLFFLSRTMERDCCVGGVTTIYCRLVHFAAGRGNTGSCGKKENQSESKRVTF